MITGERADRLQHAADLAGGGDVAVLADLRAASDQRVRIDHRALVHVRADVDVHRRHAGDAFGEVRAAAHARPAGHDADAVSLAELLQRVGVLVAERERADRHIDDAAHAEAEQDALS